MSDVSTGYLLNIDPTRITAVLLALLLFGIAFAAVVHVVRNIQPAHGYTAFWVVIGDLAIAIAYGYLVGVEAGVLLFFCMAAAGLPMLVEYTVYWLRTSANQTKLDI